jgi:putative DNA primase/helicase
MFITQASEAAGVQRGDIKLPDKALDLHFDNDVGYGQMLCERYRGQVKYIRDLETWMRFDKEQGWRPTDEVEVLGMAAQFSEELRQKGKAIAETQEAKDAAKTRNTYAKLGDMKRITPAIKFARTVGVAIRSGDMDAEPMLVGTPNGFMDLTDLSFHPFAFDRLVTKRLGTRFDQHAKAPMWDNFLKDVQPDAEMRAFLQRLMGYTLTGVIAEHILPFHWGHGGNGKGTFFERAMMPIFGDYAGGLTPSLAFKSKNERPPDVEIHQLAGKRFLMGPESSHSLELNEAWLKGASGGDRQKGRGLYRNFFEYQPTAKIHLVGNHKPVVQSVDSGFWRRFIMVEWGVEIPDHKRDHALPAKIASELPGILNWILEGARAWRQDGLKPPTACMEATQIYRENSDPLADFIDTKLMQAPESQASKAEVFQAYTEWCDQSGIHRPMTKRGLGMALMDRKWKEYKDSHGSRHWVGWKTRHIVWE